ncbi:MAG: hypothetical protein PWP27_1211 [Clostridiales bacterium]|nr:hypothetical protein [Clostridiales bacterium]MDK2933401.1 hypothetical protein [Clostridiales bacterium]
MAELADALDSGSSEYCTHAGSSPVSRTKCDKDFSDLTEILMLF